MSLTTKPARHATAPGAPADCGDGHSNAMQGAATSRQAAEVTLSATQTDSDAAARARTRNDRGECSSASPVQFVAWPGLDDQRGDGTGRKRDSHFDRAWGCGSQWQAVVDVITGNSRRRLVSTRSPVFARHWATTGPRPSCTTWPRGFRRDSPIFCNSSLVYQGLLTPANSQA
jgi:hypothetical protein